MVSEAVEIECERGDPELVKRRRKLLDEVSLFEIDEKILKLARLLAFRAPLRLRPVWTQYTLPLRQLRNVNIY